MALHSRVFGPPDYAVLPPDFHYRKILLEHPWVEDAVPSLVFEDPQAGIVGFVGVVPRAFQLNGRRIRLVVPTRFMVDPTLGGKLVAPRLLRRVLQNELDGCFSDRANDASWGLIAKSGAQLLPTYSLAWTKVLRPGRRLSARVRQRGGIAGALGTAARPVLSIADLGMRRRERGRLDAAVGGTSSRACDPEELIPFIRDDAARCALHPAYDADSLRWLLTARGELGAHLGALRGGCVFDSAGARMGWYLWHVRPGDVSEVVQVWARTDRHDVVVAHLLREALDQGVASVWGLVEPRLLPALRQARCTLSFTPWWRLLHSADHELHMALHKGDAYLSLLEGEWW